MWAFLYIIGHDNTAKDTRVTGIFMRSIAVLVVGILCFAGVDATGDTLQMKAAQIAGKNDAKGFHRKWFSAGYLFIHTTPIVLIVANHYFHEYRLDDTFGFCCLAMGGMYALSPTAAALIHSPIPPADRLLGKSPQWVDAYTKAYQKNMRKARAASSAVGCVVGTATLASILYMVFSIN